MPDDFIDGTMELVHFCDGSLAGYGAMSFLRIVSKAHIHVALITSKGRLAPLKQISVPRLERLPWSREADMNHRPKDIHNFRLWPSRIWSTPHMVRVLHNALSEGQGVSAFRVFLFFTSSDCFRQIFVVPLVVVL